VVIGENDSFQGPEEYSQSRGVELINLDLDECKQLMRRMMEEKPALWAEDIGEE
jgi:cytosine/creatinine deaminase